MKTFTTRIMMTLTAVLVSVTSVLAGSPAITFTEKSHDFGNIKEEKGAVKHEFKFINTGDEPLVIIDAKASCGCTRPTYPTAPIKPGKSGTIKVTYLPAGRPGEFNKTIKVRTNDKKNKKVTLRVTGTVIPKD